MITDQDLTEWSAERFDKARAMARRGESVPGHAFLMLEKARQYHMAQITHLELAMGMEPSDSEAVVKEAIKRLRVVPEVRRMEELLDKLLALPRYDCQGPDGDYGAGMEPGEGYIDYYAVEDLIRDYRSQPQRSEESK